jgi:predicted RNA-binding Zn-ribbon protein involved in translation (DUF1610 family)
MAGLSGKKIPNDDVLEFVVREVLCQRSADSQKELAELVNKKFAATGSGFRVSPSRARAAALKVGSKLLIKTRKGQAPVKCPGCGRRLKKAYIRNLKGRNMVFSMKCPHCGYEGKSGRWSPSRYGFGKI